LLGKGTESSWTVGEIELAKASEFYAKMAEYFGNPVTWASFLFIVIKVFVIFIAGRIIIHIASKAINRLMIDRQRNPLRFDARRSKTIGRLFENVVSYVVNFITILLIFNQLGFNLAPLLAGAGVLGLAIGFGAQSMVKDVITGFFIIFEDQFAVGDVIQVATYKGTVESIGLRVTTIRTWTGEIHIIPNGQIQTVTNYSVYNSLAVVDVSFSHEDNLDRAVDLLKEALKNIHQKDENIVKEPEILGVQALNDTSATLRIIAECRPNMQGKVMRDLNGAIRKLLRDPEVKLANPQSASADPGEKG
jgi:small-conductance mechanosensitive channel